MIDTLKTMVAAELNALDQEKWKNLALSSASDVRWHNLTWWNNKYYRESGSNDGREVQIPRKGCPEVPYKRELFHPSPNSRFSLGAGASVAYFSNDFAINCCETIEHFSGNPELSLEDLLQYGGGNPTPGWHGYPLNFHLVANTVILDLSSEDTLFFGLLNVNAQAAIWEIITNRDDQAKRCTQKIAIAAGAAGFDGIVYSSVRAPIDAVMPDTNLVLFNKAAIKSGSPLDE